MNQVATLLWLTSACSMMLAGACDAAGKEGSRSVPKASCGTQDRTESLQGQTTLAERFAPGAATAHNCNLELVGQFEGEGAGHFMAAFGNCAYYSTFNPTELKHPGVAVIDVADSRRPKAAAYLDSPAMLEANESLEFDPGRKLLLGTRLFDTTFEIYDISADCRAPVLKGSTSLPGMALYSGQFVADGRTFYGAPYANRAGPGIPPQAVADPAVFAVDTSDPAHLRPIVTWKLRDDWRTHSVRVNPQGTRAYVVLMGSARSKARDANGLAIFDVSDVQARRPEPKLRVVSTHFWEDSSHSEFAVAARIAGRDHLIVSDIGGTFVPQDRGSPADACKAGKSPYGFARIIDISQDQNPRTVSKLMLEASDPANCAKVVHDPVAGFGYSSFGCDVDNKDDARLLACGYFEAGLRVFDIRDPSRPKEIAYYKPPARRTARRPGSILFASTGPQKDRTADEVIFARFGTKPGEIWFTSADNGFQVVQFSSRFRSSNPDLFSR